MKFTTCLSALLALSALLPAAGHAAEITRIDAKPCTSKAASSAAMRRAWSRCSRRAPRC